MKIKVLSLLAICVFCCSFSLSGFALDLLIERLKLPQTIETVRPEKTAKALKECIGRDYVHVTFKSTGTEVSVQLDRRYCIFSNGNFETARGKVRLVGDTKLNSVNLRCVVDIDLATCEGIGYLEKVAD